MSVPVDSLNIKADVSARSANQQLDKLVQKMVQLRSTVNGINIGNLNKMAAGIQNFSKAVTGLNQVKTSDFTRMAKNIEKLTNVNSSNLDKSAQSVEKAANSLQRASSVSKKAISSGLKFDASGVQDMQKAIQSLSNEYANVGKGKAFEGTLEELEKEAEKLRKKLDSLSEKEEKILTVGGTSTESKTFKNLQFDISRTLNQLSELEEKIAKVRSAQDKNASSFPIYRYDVPAEGANNSGQVNYKKNEGTIKNIPESAKYSVRDAKKSLEDALKEVRVDSGSNTGFRNYTEEIKNLKANLKSLEQSGKGMGSDEWEQVYLKLRKVTLEAKEYKYAMDHPVTEIDEEIKKTDSLGNHIEALKAKLKDLQAQGLNFGDSKFDSTYRELQKSTAELKKYKSSLVDTGNTTKSVASKITDGFRSIWNVTKKAGSGVVSFGANIKNLTTRFHSMSSSTNGLIGKIMKLYIGFQSLRGVGNFLKDSVESSMDYIEEYNYFNTTMEKIASEWSKDYKKYGYKNADEYGKSFQGRLTDTMNKMTGYQMNDDGTLTDSQNKNLGLDVTQMTNYAAGIAQVTNSVGMTGEASVVTSKALSMLAGDMSSFRNLDMSTVMNNFSSGLIGQSRALYKYGIDITNATLATYAHEMGIKKDISAMTQNEKMQLRMIAILDQSKVAWGDLAKTINSPSNQLRLLQNNFKSLSRTIGNMFLPIVAKVLPYVNGLVIAIRRLFEWTASMLGIDLKDVIGDSGGGYSDAFDGLEEDADNASNAVDDTTDSVKKLAKQLMGFDELNVITTNKSDKDKDKDGSSAPIDLTSQLSAALADYEKVWNQAYKDMTSDAEKFADKLTKLFKDAWTSGDGSDIGSAIAKWLNKGIKWVNENVDTFAAGLKKIANMLATGVNGFVETLDWDGLGTAIGKSLKAYFDAETHFFDTVNWVNFGSSLATSLNAAIDSGVIQSYIKSVASKLRAAIEFAFGAITTFKFDNLGKAIGQGINDFLDTMGKKNKQTGLTGWEELGKSISDGISGILESITIALDTVRWEDVGQAIADFISSMNTSKIGWNLGKLAKSLATSFYTLVSDKETWAELGTKIADGINGFFKGMNDVDAKTGMTGWEGLGKGISDTLGGIANTISTALDGVDWDSVGGSIVDIFANIDWIDILSSAAGLIGSLAKGIFELLKGALKKDIEYLQKYLPDWIKGIGTFAISLGVKLGQKAKDFGKTVQKFIKDLPKNIIGLALAIGTKLKDLSDDITSFLLGLPSKAFGFALEIISKLTDITKKVTDFINKLPSRAFGFLMKIASKKDDIIKKITSFIHSLPSKAFGFLMKIASSKKDIGDKIGKFIKELPGKAFGMAIKIATSAKKLGDSIGNLIKSALKLVAGIATIPFKVEFAAVKAAIKTIIGWINSYVIGAINKIKVKIPSWVPGMGGKKFGFDLPKIKIPAFANGGFPQKGDLFWANENGPEMVGMMGNRPTVANNTQIVQSVSDGVFNALAPVLTQVINAINGLQSNQMGGQPLYVEGVSDGDIVRITTNANSQYKKRYGKPMYS